MYVCPSIRSGFHHIDAGTESTKSYGCSDAIGIGYRFGDTGHTRPLCLDRNPRVAAAAKRGILDLHDNSKNPLQSLITCKLNHLENLENLSLLHKSMHNESTCWMVGHL